MKEAQLIKENLGFLSRLKQDCILLLTKQIDYDMFRIKYKKMDER